MFAYVFADAKVKLHAIFSPLLEHWAATQIRAPTLKNTWKSSTYVCQVRHTFHMTVSQTLNSKTILVVDYGWLLINE